MYDYDEQTLLHGEHLTLECKKAKNELPKLRNPRMQKMFRLIGYGENIGSGFPKILHAWKQVEWKEPKLENKLVVEEVVLTLYVPEVGEDETTRKTTQKLSEVQERMLAYLRNNPKASRKELSENMDGLTEDGVKYNLNRLKEMGIILRVGPDKGGHWEIL